MRMEPMDIIVLLLFCYACLTTSSVSKEKRNIRFVSTNFFNVLHWDAGSTNDSGREELYSVRYRKYGEEALYHVKECQNIKVRSCDLTNATLSLPDSTYIAKVFADGRCIGHNHIKFNPLAQTNFSSPTLTYKYDSTSSQLYVNATLPLGPNGSSIAEHISKSKYGNHEVVIYYNLIVNQSKGPAYSFTNTTGRFNVKLRSNEKYCGSVDYRPSFEWGRKRSEKANFCVTASEKPHIFHWILLGGVLLTAIGVLLAVCACTYLKAGKLKSLPQSLVVIPGNHAVLQVAEENCVISKLAINSLCEKTVYAKIRVPPTVSSPPGYSPQDIPFPSWGDISDSSVAAGSSSPMSGPENRSGQFSEIYGAVVHVRAPDEEDEEESNLTPMAVSDPSLNRTSLGVSLATDHCPVENSSGNQIILQTFRDTNGNLVLPSRNFELESSRDDGAERKPLLSDLLNSDGEPLFASLKSSESSEWSDSGCDDSTFNTPTDSYCNTNYFPTTVLSPSMHLGPHSRLPDNGALEPDYKPNWIPSVHQKPAEGDNYGLNYPRLWNGHRTEEEVREDEGNEEDEDLTEILLGNWNLQLRN